MNTMDYHACMVEPTKIDALTSKENLPTDTSVLQDMVLTLLGRIDDLSGQLYYLKRQLFGKKSEKLNPAQRLLFEDLYHQVQARIDAQQTEADRPVPQEPKQKHSRHQGRKPLPDDLPREIIEIEPGVEEKMCSVCDGTKACIGSEETEKLEYIPASFKVIKYVRHKYACKRCQSHVSIGSLPPMAIDKGIAGEGLPAHIITSKYGDHRVQGKAVYKMRDGPSLPEYRFWQ